jgi:hypothetical protein
MLPGSMRLSRSSSSSSSAASKEPVQERSFRSRLSPYGGDIGIDQTHYIVVYANVGDGLPPFGWSTRSLESSILPL